MGGSPISWPTTVLAMLLALSFSSDALADTGRASAFVVNGEPVATGEGFATVALIQVPEDQEITAYDPFWFYGGFFCSGVLIAPEVVVTAAHCVNVCDRNGSCDNYDDCVACTPRPIDVNRVVVVAGATNVEDAWNAESIAVDEIILHPDYFNLSVQPLAIGECAPSEGFFGLVCDEPGLGPVADIALVRLRTSMVETAPVQIATFAETEAVNEGLIQGYGQARQPGDRALLSEDQIRALLRQTESTIERVVDGEVLTARGVAEVGTCYGDSGGPLYVGTKRDLAVAGTFSRFRLDAPDPCVGGGIHIQTASHQEWIFETAPEVARWQQAREAGGGCTAARSSAAPALKWLFALLFLAYLYGRCRIRVGALVAVSALALAGCGSDEEASLCIPPYDPIGFYCSPDEPVLDLQSAVRRAKELVGPEVMLIDVRNSGTRPMDPDGKSAEWFFTYYLPNESTPAEMYVDGFQLTSAGVFNRSLAVWSDPYCIPDRGIAPLDSQSVIHDAVLKLEETDNPVRLGENGVFRFSQTHVCRSFNAFERNVVEYGPYKLIYDDIGTFVAIERDPVAGDAAPSLSPL